MKSKLVLVSAALLAGIAGCGGGGAGAPVVDNSVPASATTSIEAFVQYLVALALNDGAEPLDIDAVTPPVSETALPIELS